jgi:hypothetical protein
MSSGINSELPASDEDTGAVENHQDAARRALAGWSPRRARPDTPPEMAEELVHLQAAFPAFSFGIGRGWRGLTFEAWRDAEEPGVYALITSDADELWYELEACQ